MATKGGKAPSGGEKVPPAQPSPGRWRGDAVEDERGDVAELAADRAEGNRTVRADEESRRIHSLSAGEEPGAPRRAGAPHDRPSDDEEIEDVAEEHRARRAGGERPLGKL